MTTTDDLIRQARNAAIDTMPTRKLAEDTLYWLMADEIERLRAENARMLAVIEAAQEIKDEVASGNAEYRLTRLFAALAALEGDK